MSSRQPIKVLVVDDSAVVRETLSSVIAMDSRLTVIGAAVDPFDAAKHIKVQVPDVIVLDVEMPRMDGITFLRRIMSQRPIPVVICSAMVPQGSKTLIDAMEAGAVEIIQKPKVGTRQFLEESSMQINDRLVAAATAKLDVSGPRRSGPALSQAPNVTRYGEGFNLIAIGSSTGGTEAIKTLVNDLPKDGPPIAIVQHMPEHFTDAFAKHLNNSAKVKIIEAVDGTVLQRGTVSIAPGNRHMKIVPAGGDKFRVQVEDGPLFNRHRPSVDMMFNSLSTFASSSTLAVILTGMGDDGARGLKAIRDAGGTTLGQDEASCVVYGMSRNAKMLGGVMHEVSLAKIRELMLTGRRGISGAGNGARPARRIAS
ncbi:MAG: chemotaxis response regulator protein-glutamate methylesterase [Pseudomonadota bacterium]